MAKIIVDGQEIDVPAEYTLLQACEAAGAQIPRFCYHERLSVAGNCRMCLVEVKGAPKEVASCSQQVKDQRPGPNGEPPEIITKSEKVKKSRQGVMEFLLINHPLDCPICDQGGECDLQDQAMVYGKADSRFCENKRAVEEKHMGPLVKTVMTRCIQCTRCVRFATEIAGVHELGLSGRGEDVEITTYLEAALTSELSANIVDLCPVGALTSAPYAFNARPWELSKTLSVDIMDAVGSNVHIDTRGTEVLRIGPILNEHINEEWLSDKGRHSCDGLKRQRLDRPYLRKNGKLAEISWEEALGVFADKLDAKPEKIGFIAGDLISVESAKAALDLARSLGVNNTDCRQNGSLIDNAAGRGGYVFNSTIAGIEAADALLIIGSNPRLEAPVLNARIRKAWLSGSLEAIGVVGELAELTYKYAYLGDGAKTLEELAKGKTDFYKILSAAQRPMIIIGDGALSRKDGAALLKLASEIALKAKIVREGWNGWNVLHSAASRVGLMDIGFLPQNNGLNTNAMLSGKLDTLVLLGADEIDVPNGAFTIYIGSHGDRGAHRADLVLPATGFAEEDGLYVNIEGRVQFARSAVAPKGQAKETWAIFRALSAKLGKTLPYNSLSQLRDALAKENPIFAVPEGEIADSPAPELRLLGVSGHADSAPIKNIIDDYYLTNPISRASPTMAKCSVLRLGQNQKVAAE